jgi:uncharacterized coiled-coil DUF342 family protein
MERMAWTDERLEERFDGIDRRFDAVDRRFDEVERKFTEVNRRLDGVDGQIAELRQGMGALQATLSRGSFGVIASLMGVIAAILVKGG